MDEWKVRQDAPDEGNEGDQLSENGFHVSAERLESYVEGMLDAGDRSVVDSHLVTCAECRRESEELRTLFSALARLERFSPTLGFANRVMAQVRVPEPWYSRAGRFFAPFVPKTTRGWAFASALFAMPLVGTSAVVLWLLSKPYVSSQGLFTFVTRRAWGQVAATADSVLGAIVQSDVMLALVRGLQNVVEAGATGAGAAGVAFAMITAWSSWVLYHNLFRKPSRGSDYATFSF